MIFATVTGGLGNQMFQYAYAYALSKELGDQIVLNTSQMGKRELELRNLSLQHLNLDIDVDNHLKWQKIIDFFFQTYRKIGIRCLKIRGVSDASIFEKMAKLGIYYCPDIFGYYPLIHTNRKIKYVEGAFQAYKYIEKCPELKELMREHSDKGNTVFFSTHVLEVAEKICDKIAVIDKGKIKFVGTCEELREKWKSNSSLEELFLKIIEE